MQNVNILHRVRILYFFQKEKTERFFDQSAKALFQSSTNALPQFRRSKILSSTSTQKLVLLSTNTPFIASGEILFKRRV